MNNMDDIFNDEKLERAIKRGKRKSNLKTAAISIVVALAVLVGGAFGNYKISLKISNDTFAKTENIVRLTIPRGYISSSYDSMGLLGGKGTYKISRSLGSKSVVLEERIISFGLIPQPIMTRMTGGSGHKAGEWPLSYWEGGYRKMLFFHPEINYKEYKNDLAVLDNIPDGKLIEMAISFDKAYDPFTATYLIPDVNKSWYWVDGFTEEEMKKYREEAETYDARACYIDEFDVIGVNSRDNYFLESLFRDNYKSLLKDLSESTYAKHRDRYTEMVSKGQDKYENAKVLGVIVYGTKEELKTIIGNPHIKAASFGVITDKY